MTFLLLWILDCPNDYFGVACGMPCNCQVPCDDITGECPNQNCLAGWMAEDCQTSGWKLLVCAIIDQYELPIKYKQIVQTIPNDLLGPESRSAARFLYFITAKNIPNFFSVVNVGRYWLAWFSRISTHSFDTNANWRRSEFRTYTKDVNIVTSVVGI